MIRRGHRFDDLWHRYTIDQVWLFYNAAQENLKRETFDLAIALRISFGSDQKDWKSYIQALSPKKISSAAPSKVSSKSKFKEIKRLLDGK